MADFSNVRLISGNMRAAEEILFLFRKIHRLCVSVENILSRYQTDPAFKAEADHLFTTAQLAEVNNMIANVQTLRQHWEADHAEALVEYVPMSV